MRDGVCSLVSIQQPMEHGTDRPMWHCFGRMKGKTMYGVLVDGDNSALNTTHSACARAAIGSLSFLLLLGSVSQVVPKVLPQELLVPPSQPPKSPPSFPLPSLPPPPLCPPSPPLSLPHLPPPPASPSPPSPRMPPIPPLLGLGCIYNRADFSSVEFSGGALNSVSGKAVNAADFGVEQLFYEQTGGSNYGCSNEAHPGSLTFSFGLVFGNDPAYIFVKDLSPPHPKPKHLVGFRAGVGPKANVIVDECTGGAEDDPTLTDKAKVGRQYALLCPTSDTNPFVTIERLSSPSYLCIEELRVCRSRPPSVPPAPPRPPPPPFPPLSPPNPPNMPLPPPMIQNPLTPPPPWPPLPPHPPVFIFHPEPQQRQDGFCADHWNVKCKDCSARMSNMPSSLKQLDGSPRPHLLCANQSNAPYPSPPHTLS